MLKNKIYHFFSEHGVYCGESRQLPYR